MFPLVDSFNLLCGPGLARSIGRLNAGKVNTKYPFRLTQRHSLIKVDRGEGGGGRDRKKSNTSEKEARVWLQQSLQEMNFGKVGGFDDTLPLEP